MKKLIINADDFGLSTNINKGIIESYNSGILTSASVIVNAPSYKEAIDFCRKYPLLDIGIHLNISRGFPISIKNYIPYLINESGLFYKTHKNIFLDNFFNTIRVQDIEKEFRSQIEKLLHDGIKPSHIDTEKHIHVIPSIMDIIMKIALEYKINSIRFPFDSSFILKVFYRIMNMHKKKKSIINAGIKLTDHTFGVFNSGRITTNKLLHIINTLPEGTSELVTHPGYYDENTELHMGTYKINSLREIELQALTNHKIIDIIEKMGITMTTFKDL